MKCFIHGAKEAIAACRNCGKGMCSDCSAYSGHTGVCPECRKKEFEQRVSALLQDRKEYIWKIVGSAFFVLLLLVAAFNLLPIIAIITLLPTIFIIVNAVRIKKASKEIAFLRGEIFKLETAFRQGGRGI